MTTDNRTFLRRLAIVAMLVLTFVGAACFAVALVASVSGAPDWGVVAFLAGAMAIVAAGWLYSTTEP